MFVLVSPMLVSAAANAGGSLFGTLFDRLFGKQGFDFPILEPGNRQKSAWLSALFGGDALPNAFNNKGNVKEHAFRKMVRNGIMPYQNQNDLQSMGMGAIENYFNSLNGGVDPGSGDLGYFRGTSAEDRALRNNFLDASRDTSLDPNVTALAEGIVNPQVQNSIFDLYFGAGNDALTKSFNGAIDAAQQRGLSSASSPVVNARENLERQRLQSAQNIYNQGNSQIAQITSDILSDNRQNALTGANILNQGATSFGSNIVGQTNAGANAANTGLAAQGLGFDQLMAMIKGFNSQRDQQQRAIIAKAGANAGQQISY